MQCRLWESILLTQILPLILYPLLTQCQLPKSRTKSWKGTGPFYYRSHQLTPLSFLCTTSLPLSAAAPRYGTMRWTRVLVVQLVLRLYWGYSVCIHISLTVSALYMGALHPWTVILADHTPLDITIEHCVGCLIDCCDDVVTYGRELNQIYNILFIWYNYNLISTKLLVSYFCLIFCHSCKGSWMSINQSIDLVTKWPRLHFTDMKHGQTATFRRLWHSVYAAETACLWNSPAHD